MKKPNILFEIAKWEFGRWYKIKGQLLTLGISSLVSLLLFGGTALVDLIHDEKVNIVVLGKEVMPFDSDPNSSLEIIEDKERTKTQLMNAVVQEELDGLLIIESVDEAEVFVNKEPFWLAELQILLSSTRQAIKIKEMNLTQEDLLDLYEPYNINVIYDESADKPASATEKVAAGVFIGIMLIGIFISLGYQFAVITGEKQLHITELVVSAISPQTWIDGKIIGLSLLSFFTLITYAISALLFVFISVLFGSGWKIPFSVVDPGNIILLFILAIGGFLFWNTFFSAIAATINDPNSSARGSFLMLPIIPVVLAFMSFGNPDSLVMKALSIFPLTSPAILSVRLVLTNVPFYETLSAIVLLVLSIWFLRKAAGKIFAVAILMYGKEPSWREMTRWARET